MLERLPPELLPILAERLQALADPLRLRMLQELCPGPRSVGELAAACGTTQPNASRHLARLEQSGWVVRERRGSHVYARLADGACQDVCRCLCEMVRSQAECLGRAVGLSRDGEPD